MCTPEQIAACPLTEHFEDTHHYYYPKRAYRTGVAKQFRELPENKQEMCRNEHNEEHALYHAPDRPSNKEMLRAIAQSALNASPLEGAA